MKIRVLFLLLMGSIMTMAFQCGEEEPLIRNSYLLDLPLKVYPAKKEYTFNDTLSISVFLGDRLNDRLSKEKVELLCEDISLEFTVGVRHIDMGLVSTDNLFNLTEPNLDLEDVQIESNGQFVQFRATIPNEILSKGKIQLIRIIPERSGVYMIRPTKTKELLINNQVDCDSIPIEYDYATFYSWFDMETNNPELIEEAPLPSDNITDVIPQLTEIQQIYWFKVTE